MTVINFHINTDSQGFQIIDALYAYYQSLDPDFHSAIDFKFSTEFDPVADLNVFCDYMPQTIDYEKLKKYQLILLTNSCEPLVVSTPAMAECLHKLDNCYLICNSLLTDDHALKNKIIWFPGMILECRKLWTEHFYPFALENVTPQARNNSLMFINGHNRAHRHHFVKQLKNSIPELTVKSNISSTVHETNDVILYESAEDSQFREEVNTLHSDLIIRQQSTNYYSSMILSGVNGKFGKWQPGYRILKEYFTYHCIIFPESTWQNNEMAITEKSLKCFFAGCLPWPVGGSRLHFLYNRAGFFTAWNLLPLELQEFDKIQDHDKRYQQEILSIKWLSENLDVFDLESTKQMIASNRNTMYNNTVTIPFLKKFDQILKKYLL